MEIFSEIFKTKSRQKFENSEKNFETEIWKTLNSGV